MFVRTNHASSAQYLLLVLVLLLSTNFDTFFAKEFDSPCDGYKKVITLVDNIRSCLKCPDLHTWKCPTLEAALELNSSLSNTCIDLKNRGENLTKGHVFNNSRHVKICNGQANCRETGSASLSFVGGELIVFTDFNFSECGGLHPSYYRRKHNSYSEDEGEERKLYKMALTAVLNFHNVSEITLNNLSLKFYHGYGIVLTDCTGSITLYNITLDQNFPALCVFENDTRFEFGGGVLFRHISDTLLHGTRFVVNGSEALITKLNNLKGINNPNNHEVFSDRSPFGNGGGISIYLYKSTMNEIILQNMDSFNNTGIFGGAFFLHHGEFSKNNIIRMEKMTCTLNTAINSGGCIDYVSDNCPYESNNTLVLNSFYKMNSNIALHGFGGAFCNHFRFNSETTHNAGDPAFVKTFVNKFNSRPIINNNNAKLGSAFFLENIEIMIADSVFDTNSVDSTNVLPDKSNGFGAVYLYKSHLHLPEGKNIDFTLNRMTGLVLDNSYLHLKGTLLFKFNHGIKGGGMTLIERSQIIVEGSKAQLHFEQNKANIGGGMHVSFEGNFNGTWKTFFNQTAQECFIRFKDEFKEARITFKNNTNNDIFASSLRPCAPDDEHLTSFFLNSQNFDFSNSKSALITDPVRINLPDDEVWKNMHPGKRLVIPIQLFDETNESVTSVVKIDIQKEGSVDVVLETRRDRLVVIDNKTEFRLLVNQKPPVNFELKFSVDNGLVEPQTRKAVFSYCPFGYIFKKITCECNPERNNKAGIVDCDSITGNITVFSNMWFDPSVEMLRKDAVRGVYCPNSYCRPCNLTGENKVSCIFNRSNQCKSDRDQNSYLCSSCKQGRYLEWGSENCVEDGNGYYTIVVVFLEFLLVTTIVFLNSDIYDAYLPSVIFFYQVVRFFLTTTQSYDVLTFVFTVVSFEGTGGSGIFPITFGSKLTDYWKIVPTLLLIILAVIFLSIAIPLRAYLQNRFSQSENGADDGQFNCVSLLAYCFSETNYKAVVFMLIYIYGAFTQVCTQAITLIKLQDNSTRFYTEARSNFWHSSGKMVFFFLYLAIFLVILIFPFSIIFSCFEKKCFCFCSEFFRHIRFLFKAPFRDEKSYWVKLFPCYYLMVGNLLKIVNVVVVSINMHKQTMLTVFTLLAVLILLAFALTKPYKPTSGPILNLNTFDTFVLCVLCVVGVISNGKQSIPSVNSADGTLNSVVEALLWIPLGAFVIMNLVRIVFFIAFICSKKNEKGILRTYVAGGYENEHSSTWAKAQLHRFFFRVDQQRN